MPRDDKMTRIHYTTDKTECGRHHRFIGRPMKVEEAEWDENAYVTVKTITLEHILIVNNIEKVKVLKMDIEGIEAEILKNTPHYIWDRIEYIVGEYHSMTANDIYNPVKEYFDRIQPTKADSSHIGHFLFRRKQ